MVGYSSLVYISWLMDSYQLIYEFIVGTLMFCYVYVLPIYHPSHMHMDYLNQAEFHIFPAVKPYLAGHVTIITG